MNDYKTVTFEEAMKRLGSPVRGMTSMIAAAIGGDIDSVTGKKAELDALIIEKAEAELSKHTEAQRNCRSDAAWWGYMGDIAYWRTVISILKARELVGDSLPDVPGPDVEGRVVMDAYSTMEKWGAKILAEAKKHAEESKSLTTTSEMTPSSNDPASKVTLKHLTAYVLNMALIEIGGEIDAVEDPMGHHRAWKAAQEAFWKGVEVGLRRAARGDDLDKYLKELYETRDSLQSGGGSTMREG